jgi:hypothetical protein
MKEAEKKTSGKKAGAKAKTKKTFNWRAIKFERRKKIGIQTPIFPLGPEFAQVKSKGQEIPFGGYLRTAPSVIF